MQLKEKIDSITIRGPWKLTFARFSRVELRAYTRKHKKFRGQLHEKFTIVGDSTRWLNNARPLLISNDRVFSILANKCIWNENGRWRFIPREKFETRVINFHRIDRFSSSRREEFLESAENFKLKLLFSFREKSFIIVVDGYLVLIEIKKKVVVDIRWSFSILNIGKI